MSELLESHLLPDSRFLHVGLSPLLPIVGHLFWSHTILSCENTRECECIRSSDFYLQNGRFLCLPVEMVVRAHYDVVVLSIGGSKQLVEWVSALSAAPQYILSLGPCSSAPTEVTIALPDSAGEVLYVQLESICRSRGADIGTVLYE